MALRFAIIGSPLSGKTTIHSVMSGIPRDELSEVQPGSGIHLSTVKYDEDPRLNNLTKLSSSKKTTPASFEIIDYPGFDLTTTSGREQMKRHLAEVRQCDLMIIVVRGYENPSIPPYRNRIDPSGDLSEMLDEFSFADMDQITRRVEKLDESTKKPTPSREQDLKELDLLKRCLQALEEGKRTEDVPANDAERKILKTFALLTQRPILVIINVNENQLKEKFELQNSEMVKGQALCAGDFEAELSLLDPEDRKEFLAEAGLEVLSRNNLIHLAFSSLNEILFYTTGPTESHAWMIEKGTKAVDAAGKIHTDISRGFIRAETVHYEDLIACGSEKEAKNQGKLRLEGKEYIVKDGDVVLFRFNI